MDLSCIQPCTQCARHLAANQVFQRAPIRFMDLGEHDAEYRALSIPPGNVRFSGGTVKCRQYFGQRSFALIRLENAFQVDQHEQKAPARTLRSLPFPTQNSPEHVLSKNLGTVLVQRNQLPRREPWGVLEDRTHLYHRGALYHRSAEAFPEVLKLYS